MGRTIKGQFKSPFKNLLFGMVTAVSLFAGVAAQADDMDFGNIEAEQVKKGDGLVDIRDADHRVQIFEQGGLRSSP